MLLFFLSIFVSDVTIYPKTPLHEIDLKGEILLSPGKMISGKEGFYIYDNSSSHIICFNQERMKFEIGRKGNGPGEFLKIDGLSYHKDLIYVLDGEKGKVIQFNSKGTYLSESLIEEEWRKVHQVSDMLVINDAIYLVFQNGKNWLVKYDLNGHKLHQFPKIRPDFKTGCGNNYNMTLSPEHDEIQIFSLFTGEQFVVDLKTDQVRYSGSIQDPLLNQSLKPFEEQDEGNEYFLSISQSLFGPYIIQNKSYALFLIMKLENRKSYLMSLKDRTRRIISFEKLPFKFIGLYQNEDQFYFISEDGELFWTKLVLDK